MTAIILRRAGALGDTLQSTPIARRLRRENPDAMIFVDTQNEAAYYDNPDVTAFSRIPGDRIIDLDLAYERNASMHAIDAYMLAAFGDAGEGHDKRIVLRHGILPAWWPDGAICLHPNVSWANRTLPREWWQELGDRLAADTGRAVAAIGTDIDHALAAPVIDARGAMTLAEQAAAIAASACLVCGDSSMFTLVGCTDTPAVGFCTISRPEFFMPFRHGELGWNFTAMAAPVPCYGCREHAGPVTHLDCRYGTNDCVRSFDMGAAVEAVTLAIDRDRRKETNHGA